MYLIVGYSGQFIKHWFSRGYGLPKTITTDRDSKFTSDFWGAFSKQLEVQTNFATYSSPSADEWPGRNPSQDFKESSQEIR
jgi:hypothetical protein